MNEEMYIGFESYLANEMPAEEKILFEEKLQNDAKFKEQFKQYRETTQLLSHKFSSDTTNFRKNLEAISKEHFTETNNGKSKVIAFKPWYYAVAACLVIGLGIFTFTKNDPSYSDYNQYETAEFTERGDNDTNLKEAQDYFNEKQYQKAVVSFEKARVNTPEVKCFYAIALIETNNYTKAETILNSVKNGASVYKDKATWYLALSNLKQKKMEECKTYLKQIPTDAEDFDKAQKLLKDLE